MSRTPVCSTCRQETSLLCLCERPTVTEQESDRQDDPVPVPQAWLDLSWSTLPDWLQTLLIVVALVACGLFAATGFEDQQNAAAGDQARVEARR